MHALTLNFVTLQSIENADNNCCIINIDYLVCSFNVTLKKLDFRYAIMTNIQKIRYRITKRTKQQL